MVAVYGPKDIQRREDFTLDGFIKVDLSYCLFAKPVKRALPTDLKDIERYQATQLTEALSSVVQLKRYFLTQKIISILNRYPKSQIDICVQVIESHHDNETMAAMVTCAGCALASAGLDMFGLVCAAGNDETFVALMPELNQVTGLMATSEKDINNVMGEARGIYPHIYQHFVQ